MERRQVTAAGDAPPGFRFHPTDEELVLQYLRRKALSRPLPAAVIPVVHVATLPDPWDLPGASEGETSYFFSQRQAPASGSGGRRRRAASGYWKATGKDKPVFVQLQSSSGSGSGKRLLVGVKTALAFHRGKARSSRTDWVMHEYRLAGAASELQSCEWVVCRVSLKNRARRPSAGDAGSETTAAERREDDADDHHQPSTSQRHRRRAASRKPFTLRITKKKSAAELASSSTNTMLAPASGGVGGSKAPLNRRTTTRSSRARGSPAVHGPRCGARALSYVWRVEAVRISDVRQRRHAADTGSNHVSTLQLRRWSCRRPLYLGCSTAAS